MEEYNSQIEGYISSNDYELTTIETHQSFLIYY